MRYIKCSLFLVSSILISGCAELLAINDKVGDWAGQMNQTLYGSKEGSVEQHNGRQVYIKTRNGKYVYQDSGTLQLKQNIDEVFLKVRREFGFRPTNADSDARKV
ncbi:TPA: hemophilus-specific protein, partial [Mannheimia haemolytica]|nr:hemophilus-specific protein [Mannheimia haemolytica]